MRLSRRAMRRCWNCNANSPPCISLSTPIPYHVNVYPSYSATKGTFRVHVAVTPRAAPSLRAPTHCLAVVPTLVRSAASPRAFPHHVSAMYCFPAAPTALFRNQHTTRKNGHAKIAHAPPANRSSTCFTLFTYQHMCAPVRHSSPRTRFLSSLSPPAQHVVNFSSYVCLSLHFTNRKKKIDQLTCSHANPPAFLSTAIHNLYIVPSVILADDRTVTSCLRCLRFTSMMQSKFSLTISEFAAKPTTMLLVCQRTN